ncbi:MAG: hypothetical protein KAJ51_00965 [Thermoplasmata archaeon]|nr:hypothetical protein [Thermoplasmata archaeon]
MGTQKAKMKVYKRYPLSSILIYNGVTVLHFMFGGLGIIIGYNFIGDGWVGYIFGLIYLAFAFIQMYIIMPLTVCPNCVYYRMKGGLCTTGLNIVSRKIAKQGDLKYFSNRAKGPLSHNKLYMGALFIPIVVLIPAIILNFSIILLVIFLIVIGLLMLRMFVVFRKIACVHCSAKYRCPNAKAMGIVDE